MLTFSGGFQEDRGTPFWVETPAGYHTHTSAFLNLRDLNTAFRGFFGWYS